MLESKHEQIVRINVRLTSLAEDAALSLRGESSFNVLHVREISGLAGEMTPILSNSKDWCASEPDAAFELSRYKQIVRELLTTLELVRIMLLVQRAQMESGRAHLEAVSQWTAALRQTQ